MPTITNEQGVCVWLTAYLAVHSLSLRLHAPHCLLHPVQLLVLPLQTIVLRLQQVLHTGIEVLVAMLRHRLIRI